MPTDGISDGASPPMRWRTPPPAMPRSPTPEQQPTPPSPAASSDSLLPPGSPYPLAILSMFLKEIPDNGRPFQLSYLVRSSDGATVSDIWMFVDDLWDYLHLICEFHERVGVPVIVLPPEQTPAVASAPAEDPQL